MSLPATTIVLYKCDDGDGVVMDDATGDSANDLTPSTRPAKDAITSFTVGANMDVGQCALARVAKLGIWHRLLTAGEKSALEGGEGWPFSTTTTLQDAKAFYLFDEASSSASYADATSRGNTLSAPSNVDRVAGPLGSDWAVKFDSNQEFLYRDTPGDDLQAGNRSWSMGGFVYFDSLPAAGTQAFLFGQLQLEEPFITSCVGSAVYYHADNARFQADLGDGVTLANNAVVVNPYASTTTATWYYCLLEFDATTNTLSLEITPFGGATTTTSYEPIARPETVSPLLSVGSAAKFVTAELYDSPNLGSGFDLHGGRYAYNAGTADLKITAGNAKSIWFWMKRVADADTQTLMGFFNSSTNAINWVVQWSGNILYFLIGNSVSSFDYANVALADTNAHLVVLRYDPSGPTISVSLDNGAVADSSAVTVTPAATALEFRVGCATNSAATPNFSQQYEGTLDCIGVMTGVMSAGEETAVWNSGNGTEALVAGATYTVGSLAMRAGTHALSGGIA